MDLAANAPVGRALMGHAQAARRAALARDARAQTAGPPAGGLAAAPMAGQAHAGQAREMAAGQARGVGKVDAARVGEPGAVLVCAIGATARDLVRAAMARGVMYSSGTFFAPQTRAAMAVIAAKHHVASVRWTARLPKARIPLASPRRRIGAIAQRSWHVRPRSRPMRPNANIYWQTSA